MKQQDSIVCLSQTAWEGEFQKAVVQLTTELSARHQVLFIDYQYTLKDWLQGAFGSRRDVPLRQILRLTNPLIRKVVKPGHEVYVWTPPMMLPINFLPARLHDLFVKWNVKRLINGVRGVMNQLNIQEPTVINGLSPILGLPLLQQLGERRTIYYCFDEISALFWMNRHGGRYEPEYLRRVDAVVTTSESLRQTKSALQPTAFCVKNGVNFELFNQAYRPDQPKPERPIVGYLGTADNRINVDMVEYCVRTMPNVTFQFIGEVYEPRLTQQLRPYPNVTFLPPRQAAELPPLLSQWSAAMIPFVCNEHTYTIYPLKINEYLAAGLPVVTTSFSILDDFEGVVQMANTPETFVQALRHALADTSPAQIDERIAMARANSWAHRAEEFETVLNQLETEPVESSFALVH